MLMTFGLQQLCRCSHAIISCCSTRELSLHRSRATVQMLKLQLSEATAQLEAQQAAMAELQAAFDDKLAQTEALEQALMSAEAVASGETHSQTDPGETSAISIVALSNVCKQSGLMLAMSLCT